MTPKSCSYGASRDILISEFHFQRLCIGAVSIVQPLLMFANMLGEHEHLLSLLLEFTGRSGPQGHSHHCNMTK